MNANYMRIREYESVLPNFTLAFVYAKRKGHLFKETYYKEPEDTLQTIALSYVESGGDIKKINNYISKNLYYLHKYMMPISRQLYRASIKEKRTKKYHCKPKEESTCDLCGKTKLEYMRKGFVPGKTICGACYMRLRREDKRRNA